MGAWNNTSAVWTGAFLCQKNYPIQSEPLQTYLPRRRHQGSALSNVYRRERGCLGGNTFQQKLRGVSGQTMKSCCVKVIQATPARLGWGDKDLLPTCCSSSCLNFSLTQNTLHAVWRLALRQQQAFKSRNVSLSSIAAQKLPISDWPTTGCVFRAQKLQRKGVKEKRK